MKKSEVHKQIKYADESPSVQVRLDSCLVFDYSHGEPQLHLRAYQKRETISGGHGELNTRHPVDPISAVEVNLYEF